MPSKRNPVSVNPPPNTRASITSNPKPNTQTTNPSSSSLSKTSSSTPASLKPSSSPQEILTSLWKNYLSTTPQRVKLIDVFMAFLMLVGGLQMGYCLIVGNYPFNAFLAGFSATVGQFVLTASLRIQTNPANKSEFVEVSHERRDSPEHHAVGRDTDMRIKKGTQ